MLSQSIIDYLDFTLDECSGLTYLAGMANRSKKKAHEQLCRWAKALPLSSRCAAGFREEKARPYLSKAREDRSIVHAGSCLLHPGMGGFYVAYRYQLADLGD